RLAVRTYNSPHLVDDGVGASLEWYPLLVRFLDEGGRVDAFCPVTRVPSLLLRADGFHWPARDRCRSHAIRGSDTLWYSTDSPCYRANRESRYTEFLGPITTDLSKVAITVCIVVLVAVELIRVNANQLKQPAPHRHLPKA